MFAVSSVDAAKCYYEELSRLQKDSDKPLKIATIFSYAANEEQNAIGEIVDETFEPSAMDSSAKEFLTNAINDYNSMFRTSFGVESNEFQNYYRDLAKRVKSKEIDLIIVVGMFLTGFDAPTLNTLFVDKKDRKSTRLELQSHHDVVCRLLLEKKKKLLRDVTSHKSMTTFLMNVYFVFLQ